MNNKKNNKHSEDLRKFYFDEMNKRIEKELKEKYGMSSVHKSNDDDPEILNEFLNNIKKFEEALEKAEPMKIAQILGNPKIKNEKDLRDDELTEEIDKLLELYAEHKIRIDILEPDDVSEREFYRFLSEELLEHETDFLPGVSGEGMTTNYIYEEFHPNYKLNAIDTVEWFSWSYIKKDVDEMKTYLAEEPLLFDGVELNSEEFIERLFEILPVSGENIRSEIQCSAIKLNEEETYAEADIILLLKQMNHDKPEVDIGSELGRLNLIFELIRDSLDEEYFGIKSCAVK